MSNQQQSTPNWGSNLRVPLGKNHDSLFLYDLRAPWPNITITHSKWLITYRNIACQRVYLVEFNGCTGTLLYFDHEQPHPVDGNYGHIDFCMRAGVNNKKRSSPRKHPYPRIFNCDLFKTIVHNQQGRKMSYGTFSHSLTLGLTCRIPELGECVFNQDLLPLFRKACFCEQHTTYQSILLWRYEDEERDNDDGADRQTWNGRIITTYDGDIFHSTCSCFSWWGWLRGKGAPDLLVSWKGCDCHKIPFIRFYLSN